MKKETMADITFMVKNPDCECSCKGIKVLLRRGGYTDTLENVRKVFRDNPCKYGYGKCMPKISKIG